MLIPKEVGPIYRQAFVVNIVGSGLNEGRVLGNHDEQDDSCGENVNRLAIVFLPQVDFRGHVPHSATVSLKIPRAISARHRGRVSEVSQFQIGVRPEKEILRLEISVTHTASVAVVKAFQKLFEVVPGKVFFHCS